MPLKNSKRRTLAEAFIHPGPRSLWKLLVPIFEKKMRGRFAETSFRSSGHFGPCPYATGLTPWSVVNRLQ